ncbi:hypothetical protein TNCV_3086971 [Trichonephila clavipes]|nr:hypothetical protein TNCV_3086971 [Trichonephila clavipes]
MVSLFEEVGKAGHRRCGEPQHLRGPSGSCAKNRGFWNIRVILARPIGMQPLGVGGVDVRDLKKNRYESSGRDWSARSAPIGGEGVCLKWVIERFEKKL